MIIEGTTSNRKEIFLPAISENGGGQEKKKKELFKRRGEEIIPARSYPLKM